MIQAIMEPNVREAFNKAYERIAVLERRTITCNDGSVFSIQASEDHACSPRNNVGPYSKVEVSTIVDVPDEWCQYSDGYIYMGVPVKMVKKLIDSHGGIFRGTLPPFKES